MFWLIFLCMLGKSRVLMRRDKILKIACNHAVSSDIQLKPMQTSETTWCYSALDFSENEARMEQLAVKFKVSSLKIDHVASNLFGKQTASASHRGRSRPKNLNFQISVRTIFVLSFSRAMSLVASNCGCKMTLPASMFCSLQENPFLIASATVPIRRPSHNCTPLPSH